MGVLMRVELMMTLQIKLFMSQKVSSYSKFQGKAETITLSFSKMKDYAVLLRRTDIYIITLSTRTMCILPPSLLSLETLT